MKRFNSALAASISATSSVDSTLASSMSRPRTRKHKLHFVTTSRRFENFNLLNASYSQILSSPFSVGLCVVFGEPISLVTARLVFLGLSAWRLVSPLSSVVQNCKHIFSCTSAIFVSHSLNFYDLGKVTRFNETMCMTLSQLRFHNCL